MAGIAIRADQFLRTQVSAMIQIVSAIAAIVRSQVSPAQPVHSILILQVDLLKLSPMVRGFLHQKMKG